VKQIESLRKSLKSHQTVLGKLQKKLLLVTAERDSQRQLLENYEKDLTITQGVPNHNTENQQNRIRIEMLEKTVSGYKELCAKLETELAEIRGHPGQLDGVANSDQYEQLRKDLDVLRIDNEKLKKRKNELEIEIENYTLRHNLLGNDDRIKVLHFKDNPTAIAQEQAANELVKLKAEVERLRIRNKKLEAGHEDMTARINETMNLTMNVKELTNLRDEHKTLQAKYKENERMFTSINQELREVIYMLFGYKLDRFGNSNYRFVHATIMRRHELTSLSSTE
jgi:mitotic spindle assembly checkpoint protein MAD1